MQGAPKDDEVAAASRGTDVARRSAVGFALAFAALLAIAAWLRFWGLELGLPHRLARPDETPILLRTVHAAEGHFNFDWSVYPHAYLYLHWLWGTLLLKLQFALGMAATGDYAVAWRDDHERIYRIGRSLTALSGVGVVALVVVVARRRFDRATGLAAGLWLAVCFLHARDSHAIKPDVLMSLGVTAAIVAAARLARTPTLAAGAWAGLAVGAAAAAKYNGVIAAVPVCAAAWLGAGGRPWTDWKRWLPPPLLLAGLCATLFFVATSPFVFLNPKSVQMLQLALHAVFPQWTEVPSGEAAAALGNLEGPDPPAWAARFGWPGGFVYHAAFSLRYGIGLLPTLLALPAIVWGLLQREWIGRLSAIFVLAWYIVVSFSPVMLARYMTPALPALAILEAGLLVWALRRVSPTRLTPLLCVALVLLLAETTRDAVAHDRLATRADTRNLATEWLAGNARSGSRVGIAGTRFLGWGAPNVPEGMQTIPLGRRAPVAPGQLDYLVTHDHFLFWSSIEPAWLARNARHLELLADFDPRAGGSGEPVFEVNDAYYLPFHGFAGVTAPGPHVRVYKVR